jgi:hypothetical protein
MVIWYIFPRFGILCQEKSGNPDCYFKISFVNSVFSEKKNDQKMNLNRFLRQEVSIKLSRFSETSIEKQITIKMNENLLISTPSKLERGLIVFLRAMKFCQKMSDLFDLVLLIKK